MNSGLHRTSLLLVLLLSLVTGILFSRVETAGFVEFDDGNYVLNNPHVLGGLTPPNILWALTTNHAGYWMPLTWLSLQLDATISGPPAAAPPPPAAAAMGQPQPPISASVYHVDNLLQHLIAAALLFLLLEQATNASLPAFAAAMLWAIHPLRVESVAWVTERKDVLAGLFGFLALYLYVLWAQRRTPGFYLGLCIAFALSLMAKPMFVSLPLILLLLDYWPLRRLQAPRDMRPRLQEKWPLFLIGALGAVVAFFAQRSAHAVMNIGAVGLAQRSENALLSYVRYLWMQVHFSRLALFYPYPGRPPLWEDAAAALLLLALSALAWRERSRRPALLVGWLWYVITLLPMIGIVQVGEQAYADRFTYLPAVGLAIMLIYSIPGGWFRDRLHGAWLWSAIGAAAVVLAVFTIRQVGYWQNSIALCERSAAVTTSNYMMYSALGSSYMREGRPDLAAAAYAHALSINPDDSQAQVGLGAINLTSGNARQAAEHFAHAARLRPDDADIHNLYGIALASTGQIDAAIAEFRTAEKLAPSNLRVQANLQRALAAREHQAPPGPPR